MQKFQDFICSTWNNTKSVKVYDNKLRQYVEYINLECAFDIETTSTIYNGSKFAFMYEWTFGIKDNNGICYGRYWDEFLELCNQLKTSYQLSDTRRLIVYVHNLGYEFQFMRKYFNWLNVFASAERKPVKAVADLGIEFRDSYILSGYSLAKVADNLVSHNVKKLVGDLDYSLCRLPSTPLSKQELAYCNNDVEIILSYISEQIEQYGDITKIPLTNTGRVRRYVKDNCLHSSKSHKKDSTGKRTRYIELMKECTLTSQQYGLLKQAFAGGFTHASMLHVGKTLHNVYSIDFTSSYPYVMLSERFPMSKPIFVDVRTIDFWQMVKDVDTGLLFTCKFTGLHSKNTYETYLSESKCQSIKGCIINNGRVFQADELTTTITDIDLKIIKACYTWERFQVGVCYKFYMSYLPKAIIDSVLTLYEKKTTLKGVEGKEVEYLLNKGMLNSCYGMCVTDIIREENIYTDSWNKTPLTVETIEKQIETYNNSNQRFLYYPWGVWITAYARRNLWTGILNIADDYIYSDTDSIKFLNYEKHKQFIDVYNSRVLTKLQAMCEFRHIDINRCKPKTIKGVEKLIGVWDYEGCYDTFKTLGAKRYLYSQNGALHLTVAGLSKQNGAKYLQEQFENPFDAFNDDLYIPADKTGKNTHTYIDDEMEGDITDYTGHTEHIISKSAIHLSECDFTLSISKQYNKFLCMLANGELQTGTEFL